MDRRSFLRTSAAALAATPLLCPWHGAARGSQQAAPPPTPRKGNIKHSVCRWCYGAMSLDDLCKNAVAMGISSVEILGEKEWPLVRKYGLVCAVGFGPGSIPEGFNRKERHDELVKRAEELLPLAQASQVPNLIVFSGNKGGQPDSEGIENCAAGLKRLVPLAEKYGVNFVFEILNSKVDHGDYAFDRMRYGLEVMQKVASDRVKILYDIYHAQIMEGDVIRTIRDHKDVIGHYHTGGVPGRHEIDDTQELNYTAVCHAIAETGFKGYVAQEFVPARDPMTSLRQAVDLCDV